MLLQPERPADDAPATGHAVRIDRIHVGLATVPMAVTASSAFPGFFPPLELTGADVGASGGEFGRQAYTDGGVFDNLGVRMFRCLERPLLAETPLSRDDFVDFQAVVEALCAGRQVQRGNAARRLGRSWWRPAADRTRVTHQRERPGAADLQPVRGPGYVGSQTQLQSSSRRVGKGDSEEVVLSSLWDVMRHHQFHREPLFAGLKPVDPDAEALLHASRLGGRVLDAGDQLWLNRHLLEAAFRQATGQPCFRRLNSGLDGVLVSDVGKPIEVQGNRRAGGLIRTALRATDILMDRVWQLENETFQDTPGFVFAPITEVVEPAEDSDGLAPGNPAAGGQHPHGPRSLFAAGNQQPGAPRLLCWPQGVPGAPRPVWQRLAGQRSLGSDSRATRHGPSRRGGYAPGRGPARRSRSPATVEARTLQASALRRIWSTLLDYRDWTSYIYVPLLVPILFLLPYLVVKSYQRSQRINHLVESLSQGSRDLGDEPPARRHDRSPGSASPPRKFAASTSRTSRVSRSSRIRASSTCGAGSHVKPGRAIPVPWSYGYRRLKVLKLPENAGNNLFRIDLLATSPKAAVRFPPQQLQPKLRMSRVEDASPRRERMSLAGEL